MKNVKVIIGYVTAEWGRRVDFYDYLSQLLKPPNCMLMSAHGSSVAANRNKIIDQAFEHGCTHILFLDDDMAFKNDMLNRLLVHDVDIVSALYLKRAYPHQPLIFDYLNDDGSVRSIFLNGHENGLIEVAAAGMGACLIKTEVFKNLEKPWIRLGEIEKDQWCDDIGFFTRVRKAGYKVHCDMETCVGHIGSMVIWPHNQNGKWMTGYDSGGSGMLSTPQISPDMFKEGTQKASEIEGWMSNDELEWLAKIAKECNTIVEFGSHCGRSTRALGDNCPGMVHAVDPWSGEYLGNDGKPSSALAGISRWPDFERNLKDLLATGRVTAHRMLSHEFKTERKVDMVFLDGDHRYEEVIRDIFHARSMLREGGILAGHDYNHPDWPGVKQAVDEIFGDKFQLVQTIWYVKI